MDFQEVLQALCKLSNIKVGVIAERLNYDRTIISKWKTGKRLPARQNHLVTIQVLGDLFAEELYRQDLMSEYTVLFNRKKAFHHPDSLAKDIKQLLKNGYRISELKKEHGDKLANGKSNFEDHTSDAVVSMENSVRMLKNRISHLLLATQDDLIIYSTFRLKYMLDLVTHTLKGPVETNRKITFHVMLHKEDMKQLNNQEYLSVFKILLTSSSYDVRLYYSEEESWDEFYLIDQQLVGLITTLHTLTEFLVISGNVELMKRLKLSNVFSVDEHLFNEGNLVKCQGGVLQKPSAQSLKFLYSGFFSDFFFPEGFVEVLQSNNLTKMTELYDKWEQLFYENDIHLVMTKSALLSFIQTGRIQINREIIVVPMKYRIFMLKRAINIVGNSTRIHIYLVGKDTKSFLNDMNISMYMDDQEVTYIKNIELLPDATHMLAHKVISDKIIVKNLFNNMSEFTELFSDSKINLIDMNRILRIVNWLNQQSTKNVMQKIEKILFR